MNLAGAIKAFFQAFLGSGECGHPRVNLMSAPTFCPDCGYCVKIEWVFLHCRWCNAKRVPHRSFLGEIKPIHTYCRHCGHEGFRVIKKERIDAFELLYSLCIKSTVYSDEPVTDPPVRNPFHANASIENGDVFEAEVVGKTEYRGTKSAFKTAPFDWQRKQNPQRYGSTYKASSSSNIVPLRKFS